jgi:hypothetical protein
MTALPPVLSPSSILPPFSSYCISIPARKNTEYFSSSSLFLLLLLFSSSSFSSFLLLLLKFGIS